MPKTLRQSFACAGLAITTSFNLLAGAAVAAPAPSRARVVAVDKKTGRAAWDAPLWSSADAAVSPLVTAEMVYLLEDGKVLKALDATTGKQRWQAPVVSRSPLTLAGEMVIAIAGDTVHAFNRWNGKPIWDFKPGIFPDWHPDAYSIPVATPSRLLLPAGGILLALDLATGKPAWAYTATATKLPLRPAVVGEIVYLSSRQEGDEVRLKLDDGLPDTGEHALPPDIARAMARRRRLQAKPPVVARPTGAAARQPFIAVKARVAPGGKLLATVGARRWSFSAPAGWTIDHVAGESPRHLFALVGTAAPVGGAVKPKVP